MDTEINPFQSIPPAYKKRVLFIVTQAEFGGAQRFLAQLLSRLDQASYDLSIATGAHEDPRFHQAIRALGIPVYVLNSLVRNENPFRDIAAVFEIKNLIHKLGPDTVFLNSSKAGFIGSLAARLSGSDPRVIYRIGGWTFNDPWPAWKKWVWINLEKMSAKWKDCIIVNNTHDLWQAKNLGIKPRGEIKLVHNGIDPYKIQFLDREAARAEILSAAEGLASAPVKPRYIVGTIANFYPTKGLTYLVKTAKENTDPDTIFVIIGDGRERKALEREIAALDLNKKVFLVGRFPEANRYLPAFDVFVLPSVKEGFPWALLEALAAKVPVIATRVGAVPEIIEDGLNGYIVEPRNPSQITQRIGEILNNENQAREMAIQGHQTILFKFSLEKMISEIEALL